MGLVSLSPAQQNTKEVADTAVVLAGGAAYTGSSVSTFGFYTITGYAFSDQASAANGFSIEQSADGTNWDVKDQSSVAASTEKPISIPVAAPFVRVVYTNGGTLQGSFRLHVALRR